MRSVNTLNWNLQLTRGKNMREEMLIELSHARSLSRRVTESCKWILAVMVVIVVQMAFAMSPTITSVTAQQRYPWNG